MGSTSSFRDAMAKALYRNLELNSSVVVISPDVAKAVRIENIKNKFGDRFCTIGISEANMVGVAAGIATLGLIPVIVGFAMFVAEKPFEQIRNIVAYPNLNVKIISTHGGLCVGKDGATHQALEDIAILRAVPNMTILTACDVKQTKSAVDAMIEHDGPVYLRLGRDQAEDVYENQCSYEIGKSDILIEGRDAAILSMGTILPNVMKAAAGLKDEGIDVCVVNMYSIKPIDRQRIIEVSKSCGAIITVEDHSTIGGLGSAVRDVLAEENPVKITSVAVKDVFGESGTQDELYEKYGLDIESIKKAVKSSLVSDYGLYEVK